MDPLLLCIGLQEGTAKGMPGAVSESETKTGAGWGD
jgi:hypothetical protein